MQTNVRPIQTTCPYCGVGCGVSATASDRSVAISGDPLHPANYGRLCSKGAALGQTVGLEGRLLTPAIGDRSVSWDEANQYVASQFLETISAHGPESVALYVSGQLLTEDYYVANKFVKGYIGSANIDTNSRLCMSSAVVAHKRAFGADLVPGCYEDLDLADLVVFAGHNAAWTHPVLFRRMERARARGQRHVVIDPRFTDTAESADLHLPIAPQTDVRLWNGLIADLIRRGRVDADYISSHVCGFERVKAQLATADQSISAVATDCDVSEDKVSAFFQLFAETDRTVSLFSMGVNQSTQGVAKGLAIINAHLATGRIGKPGSCPFSITGQPNAMGGRETGGMSTTLAAHMDFDDASRARLAAFWRAPIIAKRPGLKAIEMFDAVARGQIKAIWIIATNPAVSLPQSTRVREALAQCPFVAVSDCMADTDTMEFAHVKLPALAWGEKDGTVTNSERCISRQRPLFPSPGEARADWRIVAGVAAAMGHGEAFAWSSAASVFQEWAQLTTYENAGSRALDLGPLSTLTPEAYESLAPIQWPITASGSTARLFQDGRFATADGRAEMIATPWEPPAEATSAVFPLALNTGRVRDHWHTMTRTGLSADLCRHAPEPYVEIHPRDGEAAGVLEGALTRVQTQSGEAIVVAKYNDRQRLGSIFVPMHWTDSYAPSGRVNSLVDSNVDAQSGQPAYKYTPARLLPYREAWRGFFLSRNRTVAAVGKLVWRRIPQSACDLYEFAGLGGEAERDELRVRLIGGGGEGEFVRLQDASRGIFREAQFENGSLSRLLCLAVGGRLPPRDWLASLFEAQDLSLADRAALMIGRAPGRVVQSTPLVCTCRNVRSAVITASISNGAKSLEAVAEITTAGSVCGSCRPEIQRLLKTVATMEVENAA